MSAIENARSRVAIGCVELAVDFSFSSSFRESWGLVNVLQINGRLSRSAAIIMGLSFGRPCGTYADLVQHPALKRWAILGCPFGTGIFRWSRRFPACCPEENA